jgi:hypothetical protein
MPVLLTGAVPPSLLPFLVATGRDGHGPRKQDSNKLSSEHDSRSCHNRYAGASVAIQHAGVVCAQIRPAEREPWLEGRSFDGSNWESRISPAVYDKLTEAYVLPLPVVSTK